MFLKIYGAVKLDVEYTTAEPTYGTTLRHPKEFVDPLSSIGMNLNCSTSIQFNLFSLGRIYLMFSFNLPYNSVYMFPYVAIDYNDPSN